MVFILLAAIWFSGWVFAAIFLIITILGLWEFYGIISGGVYFPQKMYGTAAGGIFYITAAILFLYPWQGNIQGGQWIPLRPFMALIPLIFISFVLEIYRKKPEPLLNIATTVLGMLYVALPLSLLVYFSRPEELHFMGMPVILTGYFAFTWVNDTAAYLYGKQFGKHKFFERISPKKTWEGTIAGAVVTILFSVTLSFFVPDLPLADWLVLGAMVVFFGTHGDLLESLLKRSLNIKDSGTILPGHGGILDRFDTMLVSAPFVFLYFFFHASI
jgi:phosphatidate cytidylyltransferase